MGEYLLHGKNLRVNYLLGQHYLDIPLIFKHKHLRYLDLSYWWFDERHEVSIKELYNLQTLILLKCVNVRMILQGIVSLKMLRHLDLSWSDVERLPDSVVQLTNLQTLDLYRGYRLIALPVNIGSLKDLRELKLRYCETLKVLPRQVGTLTQLRCLNLSNTGIEVLPESCINNLWNLEFIHFGNCKLPKEIKNLPNLRIFKHWRTKEDEMPRGTETLACLEVLESYLVKNREIISSFSGGGGGDSGGIIELANLNSLQELWINNLEFVRGVIDAERAKLKDKINLRYLCLRWGSIDDDQMVLEGLQPNVNLTQLEVQYFPGLKFPKWMGTSTCLPNLVEIVLWGCIRCEKLPALGLLPCLRVLGTWKMRSVKCLGDEFYYQQDEERSSSSSTENATTTISLFRSLIQLKLSMENLEEWVAPQLPNYNSFPSFEKLEINFCPKLRSTPPNSFHFLKELVLFDTNSKAVTSFFATAGGLNSLTSVDISHSPELIYIPVGVLLRNITPNLQQLSIRYCYDFQGFLEDDHIRNFNNNKDGHGDGDFESTQSFSCPKINSKSDNISNSLRSLNLDGCSVLTLLPDLRSFTSLRELTIWKCGVIEGVNTL